MLLLYHVPFPQGHPHVRNTMGASLVLHVMQGVAGVVTDNRSHCASALTCKPRAIRVLSAQVDALIDDALDDASEVSDAGLSAILPFMTPTAVPSGAWCACAYLLSCKYYH